jgi:HD-GYP domain-containing protein (c-di-GMP phosphodiesterase class II)/DNA-binding CsgD family transcriptional regulator
VTSPPQHLPADAPVRLAELMAAWSLAIDVAMVAPLESGLRICLLATRLAAAMDADEGELRRTYDLALLRHIGCTAANADFAGLIGNELDFRRNLVGLDTSSMKVIFPQMVRSALSSQRAVRRPAAFVRLLAGMPVLKAASEAVCDVAQLLVVRLALDPLLQRDIAMVYERYDGHGFPSGVPGDQIPLSAQSVQLAEAVVGTLSVAGREAVLAMLQARKGKSLRPDLVAAFVANADEFLAEPAESVWDAVIAGEPGKPRVLSDQALDEGLRALADFVDLKSPYTVGHSTAVAELAAAAARNCGMSEADVVRIRRAGWLHDLGRVAVSVLVWGKAGALSRDEWEQVRLHAYYSERVLSRPPALADLGGLGALHHERADGSGYHRSQTAAALPASARILAAADVYAALVSDRPHRAAFTPSDAARTLRAEVKAGRIDGPAAEAVLTAAGQPSGKRRTAVAGLTAREVEVLARVAAGRSNKEIAAALVVSPRTIEHHVESIYAKARVRTRAGATMFALQHGLAGYAPAEPASSSQT